MKPWRMSFRAGNLGKEMFPECQKLGAAASPIRLRKKLISRNIQWANQSDYGTSSNRPKKASLRRVAYEMKTGDVIYAKQVPQTIDRGIVTAGYAFHSLLRLRSHGARSKDSNTGARGCSSGWR
jgi:hypothetical protein